jgi:hypothetical protein
MNNSPIAPARAFVGLDAMQRAAERRIAEYINRAAAQHLRAIKAHWPRPAITRYATRPMTGAIYPVTDPGSILTLADGRQMRVVEWAA